MSTGSLSCSLSPSGSSVEPDGEREQESHEAEEAEEEDEYVVEEIAGWRYNVKDMRREYYIKWVGYSEKDNTWEPEEHMHCPDILARFKSTLTSKQLRFFDAKNSENLTGFQRNATFESCVGVDGPHESDEDEESTKVGKQRFYCLCTFEDSDVAEEITLKEFMRYRPKDAFKFCEQRLFKRS